MEHQSIDYLFQVIEAVALGRFKAGLADEAAELVELAEFIVEREF